MKARLETRSGTLLIGATLAALAVANSPLAPFYHDVLAARLGPLDLIHWINDGLMAIFFFLVGIEVKRALVGGALARPEARALPAAAAIAGMIVPALIYFAIARGDADAARGWAIPAATDIAFARAMLALAGPSVPSSLATFLTTAAVIDDLGAVAIIALFYGGAPDLPMLAVAAAIVAMMIVLARRRMRRIAPYVLLAVPLWIAVWASGVHPTVAGVLAGLAVPAGGRGAPAARIEHRLEGWVALGIVPLFGFANAGLDLGGIGWRTFVAPIPAGIILGLFVGKQAGFLIGGGMAIRLGWARLPAGAGLRQYYGAALLAGIGFTMSLFIGGLALTGAHLDEARLAVLVGSLLSALAGIAVLRLTPGAGDQPLRRSGSDSA